VSGLQSTVLGPHYLRLYDITVLGRSSVSDPVMRGAGGIALGTEHGAVVMRVATRAYPEGTMEVLLSRIPLDLCLGVYPHV